MKDYKVKAKTMSGENVNEVISAENEFEVNKIAGEKGLFVTSIKLDDGSAAKKKLMKTKDLIIFSQQMSAMLNAGTTTDKALNLVRLKADTDALKLLYGEIYESVQKGESVSEAMRSTKVFPGLLVNMIGSGEVTGNIGEVFMTMSKFYEKQAALDRKVKSAMIYPVILGVMTVVITILLVVFVLPGITAGFDADQMPALTKFLMDISDVLIARWYVFIGVIVGAIFGSRELLSRDKYRIKFDKFKLDAPVAGKLLKKIYSARAASTIASLYANGANMLTVVEETGGTIGNRYVETLFDEIYIKVSTGGKLSSAMEDTQVFDPMLYAMIEVGEESGDIETILKNTAVYFDNEADGATEQLVSLLEPVFLIIMGLVVGTIVVAIMLPMMAIGDTI